MNRDPKTVHKMYFKPISTFNAETWTHTKRKKSKTQALDMKFLTGTERRTRKDRIRYEIFREEDGVCNCPPRRYLAYAVGWLVSMILALWEYPGAREQVG
jgi:hypothetical protein